MSIFEYDNLLLTLDGIIANRHLVNVPSDDKIHSLLLHYIAEKSADAKSFSVSAKRSGGGRNRSVDHGTAQNGRVNVDVGFGVFHFQDLKGSSLIAVRGTNGAPVGTNCGAVQHEIMTVFTTESEKEIAEFFFAADCRFRSLRNGCYQRIRMEHPPRLLANSVLVPQPIVAIRNSSSEDEE